MLPFVASLIKLFVSGSNLINCCGGILKINAISLLKRSTCIFFTSLKTFLVYFYGTKAKIYKTGLFKTSSHFCADFKREGKSKFCKNFLLESRNN